MIETVRVGVGVRPDSEEQDQAATSFGDPTWDDVRTRSTVDGSFSTLSSDLRAFSPPRHNQVLTGTCVANGITRGAENKQIQKIFEKHLAEGMTSAEALLKAREEYVPLSRRANYFMARDLMPLRADGTKETLYDEGTNISLAAEAFKIWGACPEIPIPGRPESECWPWGIGRGDEYDDLKLLQQSPSWMAMHHAYVHKIKLWSKIKSTGARRVEDCIASLYVGNPIPFATSVSKRVWGGYSGRSTIPISAGDGNHCTLLVGWDPNLFGGCFITENSWGEWWGDGGFGFLTPELIASPASFDFVVMMGGWEPWSPT